MGAACMAGVLLPLDQLFEIRAVRLSASGAA